MYFFTKQMPVEPQKHTEMELDTVVLNVPVIMQLHAFHLRLFASNRGFSHPPSMK